MQYTYYIYVYIDYMECGPQIDGRVTGQPLNKVTGFIYLGLFVRSDGDFLPDAHAWVSMAWLTR